MLTVYEIKNKIKQLSCKIQKSVQLNDSGKIDPEYLPEGSVSAWGSITGTLANQSDLTTALSTKLSGVEGNALFLMDIDQHLV